MYIAGELVYQAQPNLVKIKQLYSKTDRGNANAVAHMAGALDVLTIPPTTNQISTFPRKPESSYFH